MDLEVARGAATRNAATKPISSEDLLADSRSHSRRRTLGDRRIQRPDHPCIASSTFDDCRSNVDLATRAVLRCTLADLALLVRDLVRRSVGARAGLDEGAAQ